jgi:hypothetical protein
MTVATARPSWSETARGYFAARGINPRLAAAVGVRERSLSLVFPVRGEGEPFQRVRQLTGAAKVLQPRGRPLTVWWPRGRPEYASTVLLVEGESDALAAMSALASHPVSDLPGYAVAALPGASFPVDRIADDLRAMESTFVYSAFDADAPGRKLTNRVRWALDEAGILLAPIAIPDGQDLAEVLAAVEPQTRGQRLADLLREARG